MITGPDAVKYVSEHYPHWLPKGVCWRVLPTVRAPQPPLLGDVPKEARGVFLLNAYLSFMEIHAKPGSWEIQRKRANGLCSLAPQFRSLREGILRAADVLAGEAWGELQEVVDNGKLPAVIAPHAWLLWRMQTHFHGRGSPPTIDSVFSVSQLLNEQLLRVFSHSASDLSSGSVRSVETNQRGYTVAGLYKARYQEVALGVEPGGSHLGEVLRRVMTDLDRVNLETLREVEKAEAARTEQNLAARANEGFWVWGRWIAAAEGKKVLWHPMNQG